jgi:hypothetical protein
MGYNVNLINTNAMISAGRLEEAHRILCDLNNRNDLKTGGYGGWTRGRTPEGETPIHGPHDKVWFSWMEWNYHETCGDAETILRQVGFDVTVTGSGDLVFDNYDNKTGCEQTFLQALAPVLESANGETPQFHWQGEDGDLWMQTLRRVGTKPILVEQIARLVPVSDLN